MREHYHKTEHGVLYCGDCLEILPTLADKSVDLVLTDPPYGLEWKSTELFGKKCPQTKHLKDIQQWDLIPDKECFDEIKRVGKEQIIWGGNYLAHLLGQWKSPLLWDKQTGNNGYADGELAWTSFSTGTLRIFRHQWCGAFKDSERGIQSQHPTQKPIALFQWCLNNYSDPHNLILDPFAGSGTTAIACIRLNRKYILIEKEEKYCEIAARRIDAELEQTDFLRDL